MLESGATRATSLLCGIPDGTAWVTPHTPGQADCPGEQAQRLAQEPGRDKRHILRSPSVGSLEGAPALAAAGDC